MKKVKDLCWQNPQIAGILKDKPELMNILTSESFSLACIHKALIPILHNERTTTGLQRQDKTILCRQIRAPFHKKSKM